MDRTNESKNSDNLIICNVMLSKIFLFAIITVIDKGKLLHKYYTIYLIL